MVRMGQQVVSATGADVLVSLGLGSCIGLVLIDEGAGVAGLVHIVLPKSPPGGDATPHKFADTGVPALLRDVLQAGGRAGRLRAVICGGAHMFGTAGTNSVMQIGSKNAEATIEALRLARILIRGEDTGGSSGRSVHVIVASGAVTVCAVGQQPREL